MVVVETIRLLIRRRHSGGDEAEDRIRKVDQMLSRGQTESKWQTGGLEETEDVGRSSERGGEVSWCGRSEMEPDDWL